MKPTVTNSETTYNIGGSQEMSKLPISTTAKQLFQKMYLLGDYFKICQGQLFWF